jgi:hypothetical protein
MTREHARPGAAVTGDPEERGEESRAELYELPPGIGDDRCR